jgi:DNA-binding NarL/FixJ family response regulator
MNDSFKIGGRSRPVLIADDDEFFRLALKSVLIEKLNFSEVIETDNFDAAVEQLSSRAEIGLALFDLNMPGMKNWENLRTVRECFPSVPMAVVSGSRDRSDILMALSIGARGYINKGLGVAELTSALQSISDGSVYLPPFFPDLPQTDEVLISQPEMHSVEKDGPVLLSNLTPRQRQVLEMLVEGHSNKAMARTLDLSEGTIKFHLSAVFRVLGAANRVEAATSGMLLLDRKPVRPKA